MSALTGGTTISTGSLYQTITTTLLDQGQATAPITTASASPGMGKLQILVVCTTLSSTIPTVSGCGLTWVNIFNLQVGTSNNYVNVYRAMGTPTTGSLSISGLTVFCQYAWFEFGSVLTTGTNGSGAIGQTGNQSWGGLQTTHPSLTLSALASGSATVGILGNAGNPSGDSSHWSVGSGYNMIANQFDAGNAEAMYNEWRADGQTTIDFNYNLSNTGNVRLIGLEIRAAPFGYDDFSDTTVTAGNADSGWNVLSSYLFKPWDNFPLLFTGKDITCFQQGT